MSKIKNKKVEKKDNKVFNKIYVPVFILLIIFISIAYASLAVNLSLNITKSKRPIIKPDIKQPEKVKNPVTRTVFIPYFRPKITPEHAPEVIKEPEPIKDLKWNVFFDNLKVIDGSVTPIEEATIDSSKTSISYSLLLTNPGEYYSFYVDIVNDGDYDAYLYDIINEGLSEKQKKYIDYDITYENGDPIKVNDILKKGEKKKIKFFLKFDEDVNDDDLPDGKDELDLVYKLIYMEK